RSSSASKKAVTPSRSALPSNWKQELESLRS
nr:Chain q, EPYC1 [Chlamydomonas reinhardtii]7JSX_r Chain r, EPYC1 [Chlamydomonas reinhardtii]7JSX_s Chain s, EPYC1 [Chlamydomonas reinhardtii]7JSX_t Chain t, EPYC1 [Chlamydomonas reinhardtii]7JSX_u Chain u, EPYC1 [Chlamydomonas reinhardtii]7JSX_v Chain v, EPYC1 [Chlamydomonas reinhardtii]7JSX_w Chain w, EPYC1 [Chlamydomonas reinhardtii]7JSX_x Chain x, EPYC1 [Chlamydomonas reinhardtii]